MSPNLQISTLTASSSGMSRLFPVPIVGFFMLGSLVQVCFIYATTGLVLVPICACLLRSFVCLYCFWWKWWSGFGSVSGFGGWEWLFGVVCVLRWSHFDEVVVFIACAGHCLPWNLACCLCFLFLGLFGCWVSVGRELGNWRFEFGLCLHWDSI